MNLTSIFPTERNRWLTHLGLAILSLLWWYVISKILPKDYGSVRVAAFATGYIALLFLIITLLIGPIELLLKKRRRNPVNINLRRDIGIWAALTGLAHVIFGFQVHLQGRILLYFFTDTTGFQPQVNLFGASNYLGIIATIIMAVLLILSNDISLRWLKGKRWKNLQRLNYGLIVLVVAHTIGYQLVSERKPLFQIVVIILSLILLSFQVIGIRISRKRG